MTIFMPPREISFSRFTGVNILFWEGPPGGGVIPLVVHAGIESNGRQKKHAALLFRIQTHVYAFQLFKLFCKGFSLFFPTIYNIIYFAYEKIYTRCHWHFRYPWFILQR